MKARFYTDHPHRSRIMIYETSIETVPRIGETVFIPHSDGDTHFVDVINVTYFYNRVNWENKHVFSHVEIEVEPI